jgi:adenylate cyclase
VRGLPSRPQKSVTLLAHFSLRRLRLLSGLVLFAYIGLHLLNHALGIFSLALAEGALRIALVFWRIPLMTALLYGAAAVHFALALRTLYTRREWNLPWIEILRLASGFSLPLLLIGHVVKTRLADTLFDVTPSYLTIITNLQMAGAQGTQLALLAPGWLHGCLGLWITLRRFELMRRIKYILIALTAGLPLLAGAGFFRMAAEINARAMPASANTTALEQAALAAWKDDLTYAYIFVVLAAVALGRLRALIANSASP